MSQHGQWITLDSCINDYLTLSEQSNNKYFKCFHSAFICMEELGIDFFYQIKSVNLTVNANKTVNLPADCLYYNKVGVFNAVGELVPLRYNDKLSTYNSLKTTRVADVTSPNFANYYSFSSPVFFNYWDGGSCDNLYGVSYNDIYGGGFKVDYPNGIILLDPSFGWDSLVLEYTASPQEGEDYYIPVQFRRTIIAWLAWQDIANMPSTRKGSISDKQMRRHEYFEARRLGIRSYRPFYLDQAYQNNLDSQRLVVKV